MIWAHFHRKDIYLSSGFQLVQQLRFGAFVCFHPPKNLLHYQFKKKKKKRMKYPPTLCIKGRRRDSNHWGCIVMASEWHLHCPEVWRISACFVLRGCHRVSRTSDRTAKHPDGEAYLYAASLQGQRHWAGASLRAYVRQERPPTQCRSPSSSRPPHYSLRTRVLEAVHVKK